MKVVGVLWGLVWVGLAVVVAHQLRGLTQHPVTPRWLYTTPDGRCWQPFVPTTNIVEQPATERQHAVKPLYAIHVACP